MSKDNIHEQGLFSEEELMRCEPDTLWGSAAEQKPVTCLGMEFPSDDERREYFRKELRRRLPELRQIEGFPIGTDDDIIALSDPPYYTACPNPWLNDFISQWEEEKKHLEAEGKRTADFEVTEPYASNVSEGKNNPIYMAHAYHTKVPHPAIMRYLLHYTQPGDIVFDGFCGTGMTGVAAQLCGSNENVSALKETNVKIGIRHAICSDLSPIACHIAAGYNTPFNSTELKTKAKSILRQIEKELGWMYETEEDGKKAKANYYIWSDVFTCPNCGEEITYWNEAVSEDTKTITDTFPCPHCGLECSKRKMSHVLETQYDDILQKSTSLLKSVPVRINGHYLDGKRFERPVNDYDKDVYNKVLALNVADFHSSKFVIGDESKRIKNYGISHIHQFYTKRNFILLHRICELAYGNPVLMFWFTSSLFNVSKMYKFRTDRKGSILYGTLFIPSLNIEYNPLNTLENKLKDVCLTEYEMRGNDLISVESATFLSQIKSEKIDYIFTDPPFGSNLMYSELNSLWEGWLRLKTNNKTEAIVNNSQNKNISDYQILMNQSFKEFFRILKPGKWMTVEFSNTSASIWNSIQNALQGVGFIIVNVAALDKKQGSFKAVTTTTAVKQDLVITCYKSSTELTRKMEQSADKAENVWDFVGELLGCLPVHLHNDNKTTAVVERSPKILYDRMIAYYVQRGYPVPMDATEFQKGLCEHFIERDGMFFTVEKAVEYDEKKRLYPEMMPMGLIVSDEANGIQWLRNELREPQTYSELQPKWMQALGAVRKGDILPELRDLLEENFIEEDNGQWRLLNMQDDVDKEALRTKTLLREFKRYVEMAAKPKAKIKEARTEALRAGFKQCYIDKDFATILLVADKLPAGMVEEDETLLQFYTIAQSKQ